ncbi:MAG: thioredoxin family protein [Bacteroidota bacterium]
MTTKKISFDSYLTKAMSYTAYMALMRDLLSENRTTGPNQSADLVEYTRLNFYRMERLNKTIVLSDELQSTLDMLNKRWTFLVITEAWCGDAAQCIPLMHAMSIASTGKIDLKLVLRDENHELMNQYLTNGGRAIPILICLETDTLSPIGKWGPRPKPAQDMVIAFKQHPEVSYDDFKTQLHTWYAKDKTAAQQLEMVTLIAKWGRST